jgi:2-isopropylmalate synthase
MREIFPIFKQVADNQAIVSNDDLRQIMQQFEKVGQMN